ncbi:MAG: hypothetical protein ACRCSP_07620 [Rhodoglobus sp.]
MGRFRSPELILLAVGAVGVMASTVLIPRFAGTIGWPGLLTACAALVMLGVCLAVPVHWLPAMALVFFVIIPRAVVPSPGLLKAIPAFSIIMLIWVIRRLLMSVTRAESSRLVLPPRRSLIVIVVQLSAAFFVLWALILSSASPARSTSFAWMASFVVGALIPLLVLDARREAHLVRTAWMICGGAMGGYAVIELVLGQSPLYGALYSALGVPSIQHWSVYRAEASFHHPLYAGAFLSAAAAIAIGHWLTHDRRSSLILGLLSAVGVAATVSRGSILATGIAVGLAVVAAIFTEGRRLVPRLIVVMVLAVAAVFGLLNFAALTSRTDSTEAELSEGARDLGVIIALRAAAAAQWLGSGPGTSGISARKFDDVVIENSALQLLISVGIPGLSFIALLVAALVINSLKSRDLASAAGLIAYTVSILGFNAIDAIRGMHLLVGLLFLITLNPAIRDSVRDLPTAVVRRKQRLQHPVSVNTFAKPPY